jgi:hypothetical protein
MRLLLINSNRYKQPWPIIPFGICWIASAVEAAGHEAKVLDLCFSSHPEREIDSVVKAVQPHLIGISIRNIDNGTGYQTQFLLDDVLNNIIVPCKEAFQGPIIIGGPAVGISAEEMLNYLNVEFAIRGDGEAAMVELLNRVEQGRSFHGVGGLVWRREEKIVENNPPSVLDQIDDLPPPQPYRFVDVHRYRKYNAPVPIQSKRGCALKCTYCTYSIIEGRKWRLRNPQRVADEIEDIVVQTGITDIEFTDSTFNIPLNHAKAVLQAVIVKGLNLNLNTMGMNPGAVDEELVDLMKEAGFKEVDLGVESCSDTTLRSLGKNFCKENVLTTSALFHSKGIPLKWFLLFGAPDETADTIKETFYTIDQAASPWNLIIVGIGIRVYNGSPLSLTMKKDNSFHGEDNFFRPITYQCEKLDITTMKRLTKEHALHTTNYFMYDEDERTPLILLRFGTLFMKCFFPRQPVWRLFILMRKIQKAFGILFVRSLMMKSKKRFQYHL